MHCAANNKKDISEDADRFIIRIDNCTCLMFSIQQSQMQLQRIGICGFAFCDLLLVIRTALDEQ